MKLAFVAASAAVLLLGTNAYAAAPKLSGDYLMSKRAICQPTVAVTNSQSGDQDVQSVQLKPDSNVTSFASGVATFDAAAGTFTLKGFDEGGTSLILSVNGTSQGTGDAEETISDTIKYSNTGSVLTIQGQKFHAFYGSVKKGVAAFVEAIALEKGATPECIEQLEFVKQ